MKVGSLVEIFDLTTVFAMQWQKIGLVLGKSNMQKIELHDASNGILNDITWWDVLHNGKHYRLPNYRLRMIK